LGGLISDERSQGDAGIPLLKDVPGLGTLFKSQTGTGNRRELGVLITPYVINDDFEAESITNAFRRSLGPWAGTIPAVPAAQALPVAPSAPAAPTATVAPAAPATGADAGRQPSSPPAR
jgi:general secretion pathway protein D